MMFVKLKLFSGGKFLFNHDRVDSIFEVDGKTVITTATGKTYQVVESVDEIHNLLNGHHISISSDDVVTFTE
jgi:uncharacterized protein YlzI (FlbEa/FlbD family)